MADAYDDRDDDSGCPNCGGEGRVEDCLEDTCVCTDPPCCWMRCDWCRPQRPAPKTAEA